MTGSPRLLVLCAAALSLLAACSSGDGGSDVEEAVAAQAEDQEQLRARVADLEAQLEELAADDGLEDVTARLDALDEAAPALNDRLGQVEGRLDDLDDVVGALRGDVAGNDDAIAAVEDALAQLRTRIANLEDVVNQLRRDLGALRSDHNLLEERFSNHTRHPPG